MHNFFLIRCLKYDEKDPPENIEEHEMVCYQTYVASYFWQFIITGIEMRNKMKQKKTEVTFTLDCGYTA